MMASSGCPHTKTVHEVLDYYKVTEEEGLSNDRIVEQRKKFGFNGEFKCMYAKQVPNVCKVLVRFSLYPA